MTADARDQAVHLIEDAGTGDRFLIYATERGIKVELRYEGETLWATEQQSAELFGVTPHNVNLHLNNIYEGEGSSVRQPARKNCGFARRGSAR